VGLVGKKLKFLETEKLHCHNLGILCTLFIIFFKASSKSIQFNEFKSIIYYPLAPITKVKRGIILQNRK